jgi:hypothetical protein
VGGTLAASPGFDFADTFDLGIVFVGVAVFAAVGALSHQHERAFSASLIYLGLGAAAAVAINLLDIGWIDGGRGRAGGRAPGGGGARHGALLAPG